jgi:hypothetical protein
MLGPLKFHLIISLCIRIPEILAASSAIPSTTTVANEAEPTELHPAWAADADALETNLWADDPVPVLEWSRHLHPEPSVLADPTLESQAEAVRASIEEKAKTTMGEL